MPVAFKNLMTHGSAIRTAYRTSLRSSSLWEPRHPSLRIWFLCLGLVRLLLVLVLCCRELLRGATLQLKAWLSCIDLCNDPSAGSPTETLLRLLLPLSDKIYLTFRDTDKTAHSPKDSPDHSKSVVATGGVYKGQGLNHRRLMTCDY